MKRHFLLGRFMLFIVAAITCLACNQGKVARQQVDKNALLELIKQLSKTEGKNTSNASRDVLRDFAERYELIVVDSLFQAADSNRMQVRVVDDKQFPHIDIQLPSQLEGQLTYADFAQVFGAGVESPRPKEPIGFSVMYLASKVGDIRVLVQSHQPPDVPHPKIYQILIL